MLRDHAPLVTELMPGKLTVKDLNGDETVYVVSGGFLEVNHNTVTILSDALERPEDVDATRAEAAARRARERLEKRSADMRRRSRRGRPAPGPESPQGAPRYPLVALDRSRQIVRSRSSLHARSAPVFPQLSTAVLSAFMNSEPSVRPGATWRRPSRITSTTSA